MPAPGRPSPAATPAVTDPPKDVNPPTSEAYPTPGENAQGYPAPGLTDPNANSAYPAPYTAGTTTGVAAVDKVLAVLSSSNAADIQALLVYASSGCTKAEGLGGPPKCKENEAEGTQVEGFPVLGAEGSWTRKGEVPAEAVLLEQPTGAGASTVVWSIGEADGSAIEFAPGARDALTYVVGTSSAARDFASSRIADAGAPPQASPNSLKA